MEDKTVGIYLVMWYNSRRSAVEVVGAFTDIPRANLRLANVRSHGLRTGDRLWIDEQVLHLGSYDLVERAS